MNLRDELQATLGADYALERELGGAGMSRVFVAEERRLKRKVVIKVLAPELMQGFSAERFEREIKLAASLQQANIVPVLTAGETGGMPFYTMPLVDGHSLRERLRQSGPLPIAEAVSILRDVARALAYAHEHGVVHRDIKPDNVLLSGGTAVVTDFGIAKAIADAREVHTETLTQLGMSVGTPAYVSPEQAAGDPSVDHRADLYSFGCMAYELVAGQPPFTNRTPQRLMAAHMSEAPQPVADLRANVPPGLAALIMRCLEKEPAKRPKSADEVLAALNAIPTSDAAHAAMPTILLGPAQTTFKAIATYVAAFIAVAVLAKASIVVIGLPDWVFPGTVGVMILGFAWRRTLLDAAYAVGGFALIVGAFMALRAMGIGPVGSLMAAGKLGQRERVVLAEFKGPASDSLLAPTITEAFRTDIGQSANLSILPTAAMHDALLRMQKPATTPVDFAVARDIAAREGLKAVIDGEVLALGGSYVLSVRLVNAASGEELASFSETANDLKGVIPAIGKLSKDLRSKIGESLRSVQNTPRLEKVTTPSLEALKKYVAGSTMIDESGDFQQAVSLLEDAIALDTGFAMAYRRLAIELDNRSLQTVRAQELISKAYAHRDRLTDAERQLAIAGYYQIGPTPDRTRVIGAYESLLEFDPDNVTALNNVATEYFAHRDFARAEKVLQHALEVDPNVSVVYTNLIGAQTAQGKQTEAEKTLALLTKRLPRNPVGPTFRGNFAISRGDYDLALAIADSLRHARPNDRATQTGQAGRMAALYQMRGQLKDAMRYRTELRQGNLASGNKQAALNLALDEPSMDAWFREDSAKALRGIEQALRQHPLDSLPPVVRPYDRLVLMYSWIGRADLATTMMTAASKVPAGSDPEDLAAQRHNMQGWIAIAEHRYSDAIRELRGTDVGACTSCALPDIAHAYDLAGNADSALAIFQRYVDDPNRSLGTDMLSFAGAQKRLGELYEAKGDAAHAASHYTTFVTLWKNADPELQPKVADVRKRLARLSAGETPKR